MKMSQIDTENDKNLKISHFSKISCFFSKFLADFVNWNVEKSQEGKNVLSSMLRKRMQFFKQKFRKRHRKRQNFENLTIFTILFNFRQNIDRFRGMLKRLRYGQICCFDEPSSRDKFNL